MSPLHWLVLAGGFAIAYANGANDVSKGVSTLAGSGVTDYRNAIRWGTLWTVAGGLAGALVAGALVTTFGKGLLAPSAVPTLAAAGATLAGAAFWVLLATRLGLPVSTTHAIVGALLGVATVAYGPGGVHWSALAERVLLPLLLSPVLALLATRAVLSLWRRAATAPASDGAPDCVCAELASPVAAAAGGNTLPAVDLRFSQLRVTTGTSEQCARSTPSARRLTLSKLHWLTSGATSFARGVNDAPKMAALMLAAFAAEPGGAPSVSWLFVAVTAGMAAGSHVGGRRVTEVLAEKVTPLGHADGLSANLVSATLVTTGAVFGLPMSTTHVSSGAILGVAAGRVHTLNRKTLREMVLAWVATLPGAALLGVGAYGTLRWALG